MDEWVTLTLTFENTYRHTYRVALEFMHSWHCLLFETYRHMEHVTYKNTFKTPSFLTLPPLYFVCIKHFFIIDLIEQIPFITFIGLPNWFGSLTFFSNFFSVFWQRAQNYKSYKKNLTICEFCVLNIKKLHSVNCQQNIQKH